MPNKDQVERLIKKLKHLVDLNGKDSPFAEELKNLQQPVSGVPAGTPEGDTEKPKKEREQE